MAFLKRTCDAPARTYLHTTYYRQVCQSAYTHSSDDMQHICACTRMRTRIPARLAALHPVSRLVQARLRAQLGKATVRSNHNAGRYHGNSHLTTGSAPIPDRTRLSHHRTISLSIRTTAYPKGTKAADTKLEAESEDVKVNWRLSSSQREGHEVADDSAGS